MSDSKKLKLSEERKRTAKLVMKKLGDLKVQTRMRSHGLLPGVPVVACEWETTVEEVQNMLRRQDGTEKVIIMIRRGDDELLALTASTDIPAHEAFISSADIHRDSEIGMVYDALVPHKFSIQDSSLPTGQRTKVGQYALAAMA